jgi:hypothetical protein
MTAKPTDKQRLNQVERIRHLRSIGTSDTQIRDQLQLSESTFWRRVKLMKQQDREIMLQKFTDDISSEVRMFETRIQRDIMACESIINNRDALDEDRLDAMRLKTDLGIIMIRMYREGPRILNVSALEHKEEQRLGQRYQQADIHILNSEESESESNTDGN